MISRLKGFTLIELMVALSVLAILLTIGIPNLQTFVMNSRLQSQASSLISDLNYARAEAVRLGSPVSVCASVTGNSCSGNLTWETGWIVFNDRNGDGVVDAAELPIMRASPALGNGNTIRSARAFVRFNAQGYSLGTNTTFNVCDSRALASALAIVLSNQGRVRTGNPIACP
jgi:type IV fimbrial biogenesis protein FimT